MSSSFNPETMLCGACSSENKHLVLVRKSWQHQQHDNGGRIVFFLTDQAFPPALPVKERKNCEAVLRLEFCSLKQLMELFMKTTERWAIPAGSIIIVTSATQMASGSLQSYIQDLSEILDMVWTNFCGELSNPGKQVTVSAAGSGDLPAAMSPLLDADEMKALHQLSRDIEEKLKILLNLEGAGNRGLK